MEAQLKGAVLIALVVVPQWRCPILKPLSTKLPHKSETAPHPAWQDGTILEPGLRSSPVALCLDPPLPAADQVERTPGAEAFREAV